MSQTAAEAKQEAKKDAPPPPEEGKAENKEDEIAEGVAEGEDEGEVEGNEGPAEGQLAHSHRADYLPPGDDMENNEGGAEYRRKSFHARAYDSKTIEETRKEVEELIVKKRR